MPEAEMSRSKIISSLRYLSTSLLSLWTGTSLRFTLFHVTT